MGDLTLPGSIPGLLRRGAPVRVRMNRNGVDDWYPAIYLGSPHEDNVDAGDAVLMLDADLEDDVHGWASVMSSGLKFVALDLTDPAGVDRAARWVAEKVGVKHGLCAPEWRRVKDAWHTLPGCPACGTGKLVGPMMATPRYSCDCGYGADKRSEHTAAVWMLGFGICFVFGRPKTGFWWYEPTGPGNSAHDVGDPSFPLDDPNADTLALIAVVRHLAGVE